MAAGAPRESRPHTTRLPPGRQGAGSAVEYGYTVGHRPLHPPGRRISNAKPASGWPAGLAWPGLMMAKRPGAALAAG